MVWFIKVAVGFARRLTALNAYPTGGIVDIKIVVGIDVEIVVAATEPRRKLLIT